VGGLVNTVRSLNAVIRIDDSFLGGSEGKLIEVREC
jgi:hypothetical protein